MVFPLSTLPDPVATLNRISQVHTQHKEPDMGNPASDKRKATEKRRKRYEERLGPGVYLPKAERLEVNAAVAKAEAAEKERLAKAKVEREARRKAKKAAPKPAAPPAPEEAKA